MPKTQKQFPLPGSVYAFPLSNGLFASCWVLQNRKIDGDDCCFVVCLSHIGEKAPTEADNIKVEVLVCDHHGIEPKACPLWVDELPPKEFVFIGMSDVPNDHPLLQPRRKYESFRFGGWESFHYDALTQWRWENDREAMLAEEAEEDRIAKERQAAALAEIEQERRSMTLEKLVKYTFFPDWDDYPPKLVKTKCRRAMRALAKALIGLGASPKTADQKVEFQNCVMHFNKLNSKHEEIGDTAVREDIVDAICLFEHAAGYKNLPEQIDAWREW